MAHIFEKGRFWYASGYLNGKRLQRRKFTTREAAEKYSDDLKEFGMSAHLHESTGVSKFDPTKGPLTPQQVLRGAKPHVLVSGIYFLINEGEIVYVGQSRDVHTRLAKHQRMKLKQFSHTFILLCQIDQLLILEQQYIRLFKPKQNVLPGSWITPLHQRIADAYLANIELARADS